MAWSAFSYPGKPSIVRRVVPIKTSSIRLFMPTSRKLTSSSAASVLPRNGDRKVGWSVLLGPFVDRNAISSFEELLRA